MDVAGVVRSYRASVLARRYRVRFVVTAALMATAAVVQAQQAAIWHPGRVVDFRNPTTGIPGADVVAYASEQRIDGNSDCPVFEGAPLHRVQAGQGGCFTLEYHLLVRRVFSPSIARRISVLK